MIRQLRLIHHTTQLDLLAGQVNLVVCNALFDHINPMESVTFYSIRVMHD